MPGGPKLSEPYPNYSHPLARARSLARARGVPGASEARARGVPGASEGQRSSKASRKRSGSGGRAEAPGVAVLPVSCFLQTCAAPPRS